MMVPPSVPFVEQISSNGGYQTEERAHAVSVCENMLGSGPLTTDGVSSVMTILNPCGELGSDQNAKFPDGTLSQSGIQRFRQFETIVAPWQTISTSANVTNNWSLYLLSPAAFRTVSVFVAVRDARSLSDVEFRELFTHINTSTSLPNYPDWEPLGSSSLTTDPNIYFSVYSFKAANLDLDPGSGESKSIESFRIVGDGMVVMHNSPTLWDQGSFACGQFKTDFAFVETDTTTIPLVFSFVASRISSTSVSGVLTLSYQNPANPTGSVIMSEVVLNDSAVGSTGAFPIPDPLSGFFSFDILSPAPASVLFGSYGGGDTPINAVYTVLNDGIQISNTGTPFTFDILFQGKREPGTFSTMGQGRGQTFLHLNGPNAQFNPSQLIVSMPAMNQDSIAQADPKFSAELMKKHEGIYVVRRYFAPKLNMTNSNRSGPIKLEIAGMDKEEVIDGPGGIKGDILDENGAFIAVHIKGISYSASPTIKAVRFVEFMPTKDSPLAPFVGPTPPKDEDAEELFRQMQLEGPHSYIPDANFLGSLASFVLNVVAQIPVYLRTARSISQAVIKALDWGEEKLTALSV
jgi:hypothetical protein